VIGGLVAAILLVIALPLWWLGLALRVARRVRR